MASVIIVAAGNGKRMGIDTPKQFIEINGQSILAHTVKGFATCHLIDEIIVVLSADFLDKGTELQTLFPKANIKICTGGSERFHSVQNALNALNADAEIVFIHDGVRPFFSNDLLEKAYAACLEKGNAIPAIPLKDSIRKIEDDGLSVSVERSKYRSIQTPQVFNAEEILAAYKQLFMDHFTDDASVYENVGYQIHLIEGEYQNIKITTQEDLQFAKHLLGFIS